MATKAVTSSKSTNPKSGGKGLDRVVVFKDGRKRYFLAKPQFRGGSAKPVSVRERTDTDLVREATLASQLVSKADESDVTALCETYGLKRSELGRLTGFSLRALAEWSTGKLPSEPAKRRLHEVRRLLDALAEVIKIDAIPEWLGRRNVAFDNMTPLQVIELGEIDRLWQMVHDLGSGG